MNRGFFSWKKLRIAIQALAFPGWVFLWVKLSDPAWPAGWSKILVELDPLLSFMVILSSRMIISGFLLSLIVVILTLAFGRFWCGWLCPVGTVIDVFPFRKKTGEKKPIHESLRKGKFIMLAAILLAAVFGNLSLFILDPVTLWFRTLSSGINPSLNTAFTAAQRFLSNFPGLDQPLQRLDQLARPSIFPYEAVGARLVWLPVLIFGGIILLNVLSERFWCRYLCPLGGLLGWLSKIALIRRHVKPECKSCGKCAGACPTGTINPLQGYLSDPAECTLCMNCLSVCPYNANAFRLAVSLPEKHAYDVSRREFLVTGMVTLAGLTVLETEKLSDRAPVNLLRPPGADPAVFLRRCLRCGMCLRACPTGALQPSITESGWSGLFTPVLVPRLGYCQYSCSLCGQVCPSAAIPPLTLIEKQAQVIGKASIDRNRCLPWADGVSCIICEEMCPLPQKAISLESKQIFLQDGSVQELKLPHVQRDLCIGCGICENRCPKAGEAAIRVYRTDLFG